MAKKRVKISLGRTINQPNYASIRIDVGLESDVEDNEEVKDAYDRIEKDVKRRIQRLAKEVLESSEEDSKNSKSKNKRTK